MTTKKTENALLNTEAGKIWAEIKDKPINMFALPNQQVFQHASPTPVDPSKLFLLVRSSSVLPALETTLGKDYTVDLQDKYVVVSRAK